MAIYLGPFYFGVWGFIYLVINYINQSNLGISHSVNLILSTNKDKEQYANKIIGNSIVMVSILSMLITIFFLLIFLLDIPISEKYNVDEYIVPIVVIGILTHFNTLFSVIFRVYGRIYEIIINQSLYPFLLMITIPFFRGEQLLWASIIVHCLAFFVSFFIFILRSPINFYPRFEIKKVKYIQMRGWYLFLYATLFYFIMISSQTFVSLYYSVKEFGYFTFSNQLAGAVLLLLNSISFLIFPKMLNRFANQGIEEVKSLLSYIRGGYIFSCHLLVHTVILLFPLFIYFFPKYESSLNVFRLIALTVVVYTNAFGYQGLLIAKGKEKQIAKIAFGVLLLNLLLCYVLIDIVQIQFEYAILGTLLTYFVYVYILSEKARKLLEIKGGFLTVFKEVFPYRIMFPFVISLLFVFFKFSNLYFVIPFLVFLLLNTKEVIKVKEIILKLVNTPNIINI